MAAPKPAAGGVTLSITGAIDKMGTMTYDAGGYGPAGSPPPGAPPTGYPPPGPPGFPPPGYGPPPYGAYGPPPGYAGPGYGSAGYFAPPPVIRPGVVPLRPLTLSDMFNGAIAYMRVNPKATLGLTTIVVVAAQLFGLALSLWPLAFAGQLAGSLEGDANNGASLVLQNGSGLASLASSFAATVATTLSTILLSGLLTVVVGRAVFGAGIGIGEAWRRLKPRLWALIGFTLAEGIGALVLIAIPVVIIAVVAVAANGWAAFFFAIPLVLALIAALAYLGTMLAFAPAIIVLERGRIGYAVRRSFSLIKGDFWRVFGIRVLAVVVAQIVAAAVAIPFSFGGQFLLTAAASTGTAMIAMVLIAVGGAIGQIITGPFSAGVVVLQYTDRRIRAEAFDLVLQTGATTGWAAPPNSTDDLWLTGQR
ncbi:hypothetical protein Mycch_4805 [Mycolicibacterium chubuense NBB4]|uniref:Glycerophosphoryl diester phosphodiesterase membrane domain-containing protein n=2 Tax=Mycolicibacterium chubuense TaxID=1800 RepID=I4BQE3_MYCCN|nr:hypothetical protein Mycch_4805 [Mycolicibacterium chubuense NBB4]